MKEKITPFLKWVGGKRQLISAIEERMPKQFNNYFEPFVGGGALFMHLQNEDTTINDYSTELIDAYKTIRDNPLELMNLLDEHMEKHQVGLKDYYMSTRELDRSEEWKFETPLVKTARLMYLNKTCFNGLYRVNKKGYFNVPFNNKSSVKLYNRENILKISDFLKNSNVKIINGDFEKAVETAEKGDFIFFDPPYDLLKEDTFESYTKEGFGVEGQKRLSELAHKLRDKGCYVMLTNHNTKLINELYKDFNIDVVDVRRSINSNAKNRKGKETIIYSY